MKSSRKTLNTVPETTVKKVFFRSVDYFRIDGEGEFTVSETHPDRLISRHIAGEADIQINPLSEDGMSSAAVLDFELLEEQKHPFSNACLVLAELKKKGVPAHIEVTDGGKGYYRLWIFFDSPVNGLDAAYALKIFAAGITGIEHKVYPDKMSDVFVPLPFHGESILFQRRVFVNSVGKMIKDQAGYLTNMDYCKNGIAVSFIEEFNILAEPENLKPVKKPEISEPAPVKQPLPPKAPEPKKKPDSNQLSFEIPIPSVISETTETKEAEERTPVENDVSNDADFPVNIAGRDHLLIKKEIDVDSTFPAAKDPEEKSAVINEIPVENAVLTSIQALPGKNITREITDYRENRDYLIFNSGNGLNAVESSFVEEVVENAIIAFCPFDSGISDAVTVLADEIIPVFHADPESCFSRNKKVIIVNGEHGKYGINVRELMGVFSCAKTSGGSLEITGGEHLTGRFENKPVHLFDSGLFNGNLFAKKNNENYEADNKLFLFKSGGYLFGMEIGFVSEVVSTAGLNFSNSNRIIYNGAKVPLLNLTAKVKNPEYAVESDLCSGKRALIINRGENSVGILADSVSGVETNLSHVDIMDDHVKRTFFVKSVFNCKDCGEVGFVLDAENIFIKYPT